MSEQDSASDTTSDDIEEPNPAETLQDHNVINRSTHDEEDSYQDENMTEIELPTKNGELNIGKENKLLTTNFQLKQK